MTQDDIDTRCHAVNGNPTGLGTTRGIGRRTVVTGSFRITVIRRGAGTLTRTVTGPPPPRLARATATLVAAGHTYAAGVDRGGDIRLTARRSLTPGKYLLRLRTRTLPVGRGHRGAYFQIVRVPIRLR